MTNSIRREPGLFNVTALALAAKFLLVGCGPGFSTGSGSLPNGASLPSISPGDSNGSGSGEQPAAGTSRGTFPNPMIDLAKLNLPATARNDNPMQLNHPWLLTIDGVKISNPNGPCISIKGGVSVVIKNSEIGPCAGAGIALDGTTNVTISGNYIHDTKDPGVSSVNVTNLLVSKNQIARTASGVYAQASKQVKVNENRFLNVMGPMPRGQFVQFDQVKGAGNEIRCNAGQNVLGESNPEDAINVYKSWGAPESFLEVYGNKIKGGGPSKSGGGILVGDGGDSSFINARRNILVDPGQYGMAVPGGSTINVYENKIFASAADFTNVGLYVWNQYPSTCSNISVFNNSVKWFNKSSIASPFWNGENCGPIGGWSDSNGWEASNNWNDSLSPAILDEEIPNCDFSQVGATRFVDANSRTLGLCEITYAGNLEVSFGGQLVTLELCKARFDQFLNSSAFNGLPLNCRFNQSQSCGSR